LYNSPLEWTSVNTHQNAKKLCLPNSLGWKYLDEVLKGKGFEGKLTF